jgi:hypothetical protein
MQEVPFAASIAVEATLLVLPKPIDKFRNDLVRELMWPKYAISPCNDNWHFERTDIGLAHKFGSCL